MFRECVNKRAQSYRPLGAWTPEKRPWPIVTGPDYIGQSTDITSRQPADVMNIPRQCGRVIIHRGRSIQPSLRQSTRPCSLNAGRELTSLLFMLLLCTSSARDQFYGGSTRPHQNQHFTIVYIASLRDLTKRSNPLRNITFIGLFQVRPCLLKRRFTTIYANVGQRPIFSADISIHLENWHHYTVLSIVLRVTMAKKETNLTYRFTMSTLGHSMPRKKI